MNRTAVSISVGLALLAAPGGASAHSCRLPAGRTIASDSIAKLIRIPTPRGSVLYACIRRSGRKIVLDENATDPRLTGRWVAWQRPGSGGRWRIAVHDLRTGRERLVDGHVAEHSLGLTARGTVVWAQEQDETSATPLYANDVASGGRLLDGGAVDATSVRLRGRTVTWVSAGQSRTTTVR
jgi:hypothetical protein